MKEVIEIAKLKIRCYNPVQKTFSVSGVTDSMHYKYLANDKTPYLDYGIMCCVYNKNEEPEMGFTRLEQLLDSIKKVGYPNNEGNIVQIDKNNVIIDGCHRTAVLCFLGQTEILVNRR